MCACVCWPAVISVVAAVRLQDSLTGRIKGCVCECVSVCVCVNCLIPKLRVPSHILLKYNSCLFTIAQHLKCSGLHSSVCKERRNSRFVVSSLTTAVNSTDRLCLRLSIKTQYLCGPIVMCLLRQISKNCRAPKGGG